MAENIAAADPTGILQGFAPPERQTPSVDEHKKLGALRERFGEAFNHKQPFAWAWEFNRNFLKGDQLLVRDRSTGEVVRISMNRDSRSRLYSVENLLRPYGRALVGKLSRIIPTMNVSPASDMPSDLKGAQVAEAWIEFFERKERLRIKFVGGQKSLIWAGSGVFHPYWDKNWGRHLAVCETCGYKGDRGEAGKECPVCQLENAQKAMLMQEQATQIYEQAGMMNQEMGKPPPQPPPMAKPKPGPILKAITEGDLRVRRIDVRDFFPEPGVANIEDMRYAFTRMAVPVSDIRKAWPAKGMFVGHEEGIYIDKAVSFHGALIDDRGATRYLKDHAYLHQYHEAPSTEFPEGQLIYFTDSVLLEEGPHPSYMDIGRLPFFLHRYETNEGDFWGEAPIQQAWSGQRERNRLRTQLREHRELTLRPKLLNPLNNRLGVTEIDTTPGQILTMPAYGQAPKWLDYPQFPNYVYAEQDSMAAGMRQQFCIGEADLGFVQSDQSGRSTALQEAQSSETLAPVIIENNDEWRELYKASLILGLKHYPKDYTWSVIGRDRVRSYALHQISLRPGWDIVLMEADSLSKNPAVRQQQVDSMWDRGVFVDPRTGMPDRKAYLRLCNIRMPGLGPDTEASERAYAASIPDRIRNGEPVQPRSFDDPWVMQEELASWLREFGRGGEDPQLVMQVEQLYMYYSTMLAYQPQASSVAPNAAAGQLSQQNQLNMGPGGGDGGQQPNQAERVPGSRGPVQQEAGRNVQIADAQGENQARQQTKHEG